MSTIFKIKTSLRRTINKMAGFERPTSWPFITGDGFRSLAQHHFDEISNFNPAQVEKNDVVFVRSDFLKEFFIRIHPRISYSYILISHNDDTNVDESYTSFIDSKITHWFAQNLLIKHPKITPIPIGIENLRYNSIGKLSYFNHDDASEKQKDDFKIDYNFSIISNPERRHTEECLKKNGVAKKITASNQGEYYEYVKKSHFLASPVGCGIDCHRTWEAIYLKSIPIVTRDTMTEYFQSIGLPIFLIESWGDIENITAEKLEKLYSEIYKTNSFPQAYMEYWAKEIINKKI